MKENQNELGENDSGRNCHVSAVQCNSRYAFCVPLWIVLICFWVPMLVVQFKAFSKGFTPYPKYARWFTLFTGAIPVLIIAALIGPGTALGAGIGTTFLSAGNIVTFGGLLVTLPSGERFAKFRNSITVMQG